MRSPEPHGQSSTANVVEAVSHGKLSLQHDVSTRGWYCRDEDQHSGCDVETITESHHLDRRLRTVPESAGQDPTGLVLTLRGGTLFTVPAHY